MNSKKTFLFAAVLIGRHGWRCINALVGVFAKQKLRTLLLAWMLIAMSLYGQTAADFEVEGTVLVNYNGKATDVTIPTNLRITEIGRNAFQLSKITSVVIPAGVTVIGDWAFSGCSSLTGITIPASVTTIGDGAFSWCSSLTGITIPAGVTSIGKGVFFDCVSFTAINVDERNKAYMSIDGVLYNKDKTTIIQYPAKKLDKRYVIPAGVKRIGENAFYNCESITGITIPAGVIFIGEWAFYACINLENINIPSGVTEIKFGAFGHCDALPEETRAEIEKRFGWIVFDEGA